MTKKIDLSRREFIRNASMVSAAGSVAAPFALNLFAMNVAAAATPHTGDYKALVCLFLAGGNDHNNTVIATDTPSWTGYLAARNTGGATSIALMNPDTTPNVLALTQQNLQALNTGRSFGLHPSMARLQSLYESGKVAIVPNVGPLIKPIVSKADYQSKTAADKPANLFSHSDQTSQWHSTDPSKKIYGWGGRMADQIVGSNGAQNFTCLSLSGNSVFLAGETINQYQISANGSASAIQGFTNLFGANTGTNGSTLKNIITPTYGVDSNMFEIDHSAVVQRAIDAQIDLKAVMDATAATGTIPVPAAPTAAGNPATYVNPVTLQPGTNALATQLQTVARIIAGRDVLGSTGTPAGTHRQVFFVTLGGFDTHDFQAANHSILMARLAHGIEYFYNTLVSLPGGDMSSNVTLFTASDFGRTLNSNGDGTDHGWGSHHFVVGGAVKGREVYGSFPITAVNNTSTGVVNTLDVGSGNFIPQISVDQYAATMAKWFGLSPTEITSVFPNLANFTTQDLGFMV